MNLTPGTRIEYRAVGSDTFQSATLLQKMPNVSHDAWKISVDGRTKMFGDRWLRVWNLETMGRLRIL